MEWMTGAGDGIRTRDIDLGKVALYQLSYSRLNQTFIFPRALGQCQTPLSQGNSRKTAIEMKLKSS
jgi:hypothetical protein